MLVTLDFEIPAQLVAVLVQKVNQHFEDHAKDRIEAIDTRKISQLAGDGAASTYQKRSINGSAPLYSISSTFNKSFVFSKVELTWSNQHSAFYSTSDLDLANIGKTDISAKVKGYLEIQPGVTPKSVRLFLEIAGNLWYYLSYSGTRLQMLSSDPEFNQTLSDKSKSDKTKPGNFFFEKIDLSEAQSYIDRFRRDYLNISQQQKLNIKAEEVEGESVEGN